MIVAGIAQALHNRSYRHASLTMLTFFASWGIWWSFFQIWLTNEKTGLGLHGSEVGTIYSANSAATLVVMLLYGTAQDRLGLRRHLVITASVLMSMTGPFFIFVYRPLLEERFVLGVIVGALFLSVGFLAAAGLLEAFAERLSRRYDFEYGQARMWGSFGYAMVALVAGFLFNINPNLNFILGSVFGLACLAIQLFWPTAPTPTPDTCDGSQTEPSTPSLSDMLGLLKMGRLWQVIIFVLFTWTFYTVYDQQMFPDFYTGLFESKERGQQVYGVLNSVQVFLEAAMMGLIPVLMRRVGVRTTLLLGIAVMFARIFGTAVFTDPAMVSAVKMLHAMEVPLVILAIFRYVTLHFNAALSATLYMVGFQIASQVGVVLLSPPLGGLRDRIGYQPTFFIIAAIVAVAGVYGFLVLKRDDVDVDGDPFVRSGAAGSGVAA